MAYIPRHSLRVGTHRKVKPKKTGAAGKHRVTGAWNTNFFSLNYKPRHGKKLFGIF